MDITTLTCYMKITSNLPTIEESTHLPSCWFCPYRIHCLSTLKSRREKTPITVLLVILKFFAIKIITNHHLCCLWVPKPLFSVQTAQLWTQCTAPLLRIILRESKESFSSMKHSWLLPLLRLSMWQQPKNRHFLLWQLRFSSYPLLSPS